MAAKKQTSKKVVKQGQTGGFFEYFNFSESYTSLILGIVVVIIAAVLLVSFFKNRNGINPQARQDISAIQTVDNEYLAQNTIASISAALSPIPTQSEPTITPNPTTTPIVTAKPTVVPTAKPAVTAMPVVTNEKKLAVQPKEGQTYTVAKGDDLWHIAEKVYKDGYKWVDIARANNIVNPGTIFSGDVLKLPKIEQKEIAQDTNPVVAATPQPKQDQLVTAGAKITGTTYAITSGDDLWDIAVRAYGDGYKWVEIARANRLIDPNIIHVGNTLTLPR